MRRIVSTSLLSISARRRALHLRLERIREKIASVEAEIAAIEDGQDPEPTLFPQEHRSLVSLRQRLTHLQKLAAGIEAELRLTPPARLWEDYSE